MKPLERRAVFYKTFFLKGKSTGLGTAVILFIVTTFFVTNYFYFAAHLTLSLISAFLIGKLISTRRYELLKLHDDVYKANLEEYLKDRNDLIFPNVFLNYSCKRTKSYLLTGEWFVSLLLIACSFLSAFVPWLVIMKVIGVAYLKYSPLALLTYTFAIMFTVWFFEYVNWKRVILPKIEQDYGVKREEVFGWIKSTFK